MSEDVAFRVLAAGNQPDFRTISDFRKQHLPALRGLFEQVLRLALEAGAMTLGRVALYLTDHLVQLRPTAAEPPEDAVRERAILEWLDKHGASFFNELHDGAARDSGRDRARARAGRRDRPGRCSDRR